MIHLKTIHDAVTDLTGDDVNQVVSGMEIGNIANILAGQIGVNEEEILILFDHAEEMTVGQAIAFAYQMLSLLDTNSTTDEIELSVPEGVTDLQGAWQDHFGVNTDAELSDIFAQYAEDIKDTIVTVKGMDTDDTNDDSLTIR